MTRSRSPWLRWLFVIMVATSAAVGAQDAPQLIDRIIAIVGEDAVMLSELRTETNRLARRLSQNEGQLPSNAELQKQAFDTLILKKLQLAEAKRVGIEASEQDVDKAIANIAERNGISIDQMRSVFEAEGMDYQTFRQTLHDEIVITRLRNREVTARIQVTKSEVDSYLERTGGIEGRTAIHLLYMLIEVPDGSDSKQREQVRLRAEAAIERVRQGEDFRAVAREVSTGENAAQGGDLGWMEVQGLPPLFQPYANTMEIGELQGPIAAGIGYHIIQLEGARGGQSNIVRQTHARHILLRTNEVTSDTDARERLVKLRERIVNGEDFDTLARANSDDQASAIKGGDLGWSTPGNLVPAFEEQMNQLDIDAVSQPFKTQFGWHIVQVLGRRDYDATGETRRDQARKEVRDEKSGEALQNYLRRLRDEAYIELRIEDIYD